MLGNTEAWGPLTVWWLWRQPTAAQSPGRLKARQWDKRLPARRKPNKSLSKGSAIWRPCTESGNPFTPKSDQFQISPAAWPEILHHTVWRTWLSIAYSDKKWLYYQFSLPHLSIALQNVGRRYSGVKLFDFYAHLSETNRQCNTLQFTTGQVLNLQMTNKRKQKHKCEWKHGGDNASRYIARRPPGSIAVPWPKFVPQGLQDSKCIILVMNYGCRENLSSVSRPDKSHPGWGRNSVTFNLFPIRKRLHCDIYSWTKGPAFV